jgi:hypothetical protein
VVGVGDEAGVDLGHPREEALLVLVQRVPRAHEVELRPRPPIGPGDPVRLSVRVDRRELDVVGQEAELLLPGEDPLADRLVALVEAARVAIGPLLEDVMRGVRAPWAEVHEPRLVGIDRFRVARVTDRLVGEVGREVVAVVRLRRLLDRVVVLDEVGIPLVRLASEEPVEALEAATQRPASLPGGHVGLLAGGEVPLADRVRVPAALVQHLGDRPVLERDAGRVAGKSGRGLGDARHVVRGRVAAVQEARPRGRAERGRVEVRVAEPGLGDPSHGRRLDRPAEDVHGAVADVVPDDHEDVGRAFGRLRLEERLPVGDRIADVQVDDALERLGHEASRSRCWAAGNLCHQALRERLQTDDLRVCRRACQDSNLGPAD